LNAAECKCSIEVSVKHPNGEAIGDVDITVTMATAAVGGALPAELTATTDASDAQFS
jgi:hypothetical protein